MPRQPRTRPHRSATPLLSVLAILGIVLMVATFQLHRPSAPHDHPAPAGPAALDIPEPPGPPPPGAGWSDWTPPARALLWTDPLHDPHRIARALSRAIDAVPTGGYIKVETFFLDSSFTTAALRAAYERGVNVQIIVTGWQHRRYQDENELARLLGTDRSRPSWLHWSKGSSRGGAGTTVDHDKVWRFSQVGHRRWVTVVGSYNNSDRADGRAYALALAVADRAIYDRFEQMWLQSRADRPVAHPTRSFRSPGWEAYWLPGERLTPSADPAVQRLRAIPARRGTVMHIRMYSMYGVRGTYVADQLVRMARRGVRIAFIAGPTVAWPLQQRMRAAGIDVQGGCWRDGTFDHAKDMSASWMRRGHRVYWTWVGSDNWTDDNYLRSDQVELGLEGPDLYREFNRVFATIARRPDVPPWQCPAS